jgi:hypothetical protein
MAQDPEQIQSPALPHIKCITDKSLPSSVPLRGLSCEVWRAGFLRATHVNAFHLTGVVKTIYSSTLKNPLPLKKTKAKTKTKLQEHSLTPALASCA